MRLDGLKLVQPQNHNWIGSFSLAASFFFNYPNHPHQSSYLWNMGRKAKRRKKGGFKIREQDNNYALKCHVNIDYSVQDIIQWDEGKFDRRRLFKYLPNRLLLRLQESYPGYGVCYFCYNVACFI